MPARTGVTVKGGPELQRAFDRFGDRLDDLRGVNQEIADEVADEAGARAPVLTGRLRASVKGRGTKRRAYVQAGGRGIPYAGPIHFGWAARNIEPQPFLYDALDDRRGEVVERYAKQVAKLVRKLDMEAPK